MMLMKRKGVIENRSDKGQVARDEKHSLMSEVRSHQEPGKAMSDTKMQNPNAEGWTAPTANRQA
jgi:hypothetical protein